LLLAFIILTSTVIGLSISKEAPPEINTEKEIIDITTSKFTNYTKIYSSDNGVKISTEKVTFYPTNKTIKYDIDYTGKNPDKNGIRWVKITSPTEIIQLKGLYWQIDKFTHYFNWFYREHSCKEVFYPEYKITDIECEYDNKVFLNQIDNYTLAVGWKAENETDLIYDPVISDWEGNTTSYWEFDDNSTHVFSDSAENPNNHNATKDWGNDGYYQTDTPSGSGFSYKFDDGRWKSANGGDYSGATSFEATMALKGMNTGEYRLLFLQNGRIDVLIRDKKMQIRTNGDGTDCNLFYFEHGATLDNESWNFVTVGYNGTHCYTYLNQTLVRSEASTGTMESGSDMYIARGNGQGYHGEMDCLSYTHDGWLDAEGRLEAYNDCFGAGGEPPEETDYCECPVPAAEWTWNFTEGCHYNTDCSIDGFDIVHYGTGTIIVNASIIADNLDTPVTNQNILVGPLLLQNL